MLSLHGQDCRPELLGLIFAAVWTILVVFAEERLDGVTEVSGAVGDMPVAGLQISMGTTLPDGNSYPCDRNVRIPTLEAVLLAYPQLTSV